MRAALKRFFDNPRTERIVITLIVINGVTLGLETSDAVMNSIGGFLVVLDRTLLFIFAAEVIGRIVASPRGSLRDGWTVFDAIVVVISFVSITSNLSVLRALRILRLLRLIARIPSLRRVVGGLVAALPGMGSIILLLSLIFYVFSVMATKLFGPSFPEWFGSIASSAYTLFQVMTLESWSMGIVRPVMDVYPLAWLFFVPFILCTSFTVLNLFIGIIVSAMQQEHEETADADRAKIQEETQIILSEVKAMRQEMTELKAELARRS